MANPASGVLPVVQALLGSEPEVGEAMLLAAVYARAIHTDQSPQDVVDALFTSVPSVEAWPQLRDALLAVMEDGGGGD